MGCREDGATVAGRRPFGIPYIPAGSLVYLPGWSAGVTCDGFFVFFARVFCHA